MRQHFFMGAALLGMIASPVFADFTFTNAGPLNSAGATGSSGNSVFFTPNSSSTSLYSTRTFSGDLTEVNTGTFASEARFNLQLGSHNSNHQVSTTGGFTGTLPVSSTAGGMFWAPSVGSVRVETFESFDDDDGTLVDATWTNVSFALSGTPSITELGNFASGTGFLFDTESSLFDTEIAGYVGNGLFLASDDDSGTGTLSSLDLGALADGDYYLVLGGFNSIFSDFVATGGAASGAFNLNLNGNSVATGTSTSGALNAYHFSVGIPEPSSLFLIGGLAGLACGIRRKRA